MKDDADLVLPQASLWHDLFKQLNTIMSGASSAYTRSNDSDLTSVELKLDSARAVLAAAARENYSIVSSPVYPQIINTLPKEGKAQEHHDSEMMSMPEITRQLQELPKTKFFDVREIGLVGLLPENSP